MIDQKIARLWAHGNNITRYRRLLGTPLSDVERQFLERRKIGHGMPGCIELSAHPRNFRSDPPVSSCCLAKPASETLEVETVALQLSIPGTGVFRPQVAGFEIKAGRNFIIP